MKGVTENNILQTTGRMVTIEEAQKLFFEGGHFLFAGTYLMYTATVGGRMHSYHHTYGPIPAGLAAARSIEDTNKEELAKILSGFSEDQLRVRTFEEVLRLWGFCPDPMLPVLEDADKRYKEEFGHSLLEKLMAAAPATEAEIETLTSPNAGKRFVSKVLDNDPISIGELVYQSDRSMSMGVISAVNAGKSAYEGKYLTLYEWPAPIVEIIDMANSKIIVITDKDDAKALVELLQRKFDLDK